jgi:SAM-dependent methyltransferase
MWNQSRGSRRRLEPHFDSDEARVHRLRERLAPARGDPFYAHLADLRAALGEALAGASGLWLDYGADVSPYRELLGGCQLRSADLPRPGRQADYLLDKSGQLKDVTAGTFDGVLSTQVLEHVPDAARYLREAHRVLRPGGALVLSTHGIWEDHPGPLDLRRWTIQGLEREVAYQGFAVRSCHGLTCRRRAAIFILEQQCLGSPRLAGLRALLDRASDVLLAGERRACAPDARLYLGILLTAERR